MKGLAAGASALALAFALAARAGTPALAPPASLLLDGVPPIPADIAAAAGPYDAFRPADLLDWHPLRREVLARVRRGETMQAHRVAEPGVAPEALADLPTDPDCARWEPRAGAWLLVTGSAEGDEARRIRRFDPATGQLHPVSPAGRHAGTPEWNPKGDRVAFTTVAVGGTGAGDEAFTSVHVADPLEPEKARTIARLRGTGWASPRFSPDGRRLALVETVSASASHLWVLDVATGKARRVSAAHGGDPVRYADPHFSPDGRSLFAISDRGSEYRNVAHVDIATGREQALAANRRFDVEAIALSAPAGRLAYLTNEEGAHSLRFIDLATRKELPRPALVPGVVTGLRWRADGSEVGFTHASSRSPGDVFSYDPKAHRVTRWTNGNSPSLNAAAFPEGRLVRWKSFDGHEITGFYYHPPARFEGVRPVVVSVHDGPHSQARAGFIGRANYLVNELGIAVIRPNVRGSSGLGKTFARLDDGRLRGDAVKDLGALLDWIGTQPGLDASRVLVTGGGYGGTLALAAGVQYPERIAGVVSASGIPDLVSWLERAEPWRRDLVRAEYGDERDPAMRAFLASLSPLAGADRIARPLFVIHSRNDPRVSEAEAERIVASPRRRGVPAWYLLAKDEGHGFRRHANETFRFHATVAFIRRFLAP